MDWIKKFLKNILWVRESVFASAMRMQHRMLLDDYLQRHLYGNEKYLHSNKLNRYEFQAFSQNGEDGIIKEIFNRIGTTNRFFC